MVRDNVVDLVILDYCVIMRYALLYMFTYSVASSGSKQKRLLAMNLLFCDSIGNDVLITHSFSSNLRRCLVLYGATANLAPNTGYKI